MAKPTQTAAQQAAAVQAAIDAQKAKDEAAQTAQAQAAAAANAPKAAVSASMHATYTGPGAYRGWDLSAIPADLMPQARAAIDHWANNPALEQQMMADIYQNYSQDAWAASIPEVRTALVVGTYMGLHNDPNEFQSLIQNTQWWKSTNDNQRMWQETQANDPAQAQAAIGEAASRVQSIANSLGVNLDAATINSMASTVASNSVTKTGVYSNTQFADAQIYQMVTDKFNAEQFLGSQSAPASAAPGASAATGDASTLYNQFASISRNYYLNWTPQQLAQKVQEALATNTGQGNFIQGAIAGFTDQAQQAAKILYPALAGVIGTSTSVGTDNTPYAALAPIRNMIAQYTGKASGDMVDLTDPQWSWYLAGKTPPSTSAATAAATGTSSSSSASNSAPTLASADQLQTYLMQTPQFQSTNMGKNMAWGVADAIKKGFGL